MAKAKFNTFAEKHAHEQRIEANRQLIIKSAIQIANKWDALSFAQRMDLLRKAMPEKEWAYLRDSIARRQAHELTTIQFNAVEEILKGV